MTDERFEEIMTAADPVLRKVTFFVPGNPGVEFREIIGFDGYAIGDDGSVWSRKARNGRGLTSVWRRMKPEVAKGGYLRASLTHHGKSHHVSVRR